jgi:hypothetical protein
MIVAMENVVLPQQTRKRGFRHEITAKHHGENRRAAMWLPEVTPAEEFAIFDAADFGDIFDDRRSLYGVQPLASAELRTLGMWQEQVAKFPRKRRNEPWHGYPVWPLEIPREGRTKKPKKQRPPKEVFDRMQEASLITARQRMRLMNGEHA